MAAAGAEPHISAWRLATLKCRKDFLSVRKGSRWSTRAFVLEGRQRMAAGPGPVQPRFGFTVARAVGGAVERNRIRRRLKAAIRHVQVAHARYDFDYVIVARRGVLEAKFEELVGELAKALDRVHRSRQRTTGARLRGAAEKRS
jgi:ribonuclease P protein component